ncbi:MAG: hypothetical protein ACM3XS_01620, partial [Bacteroidota bacterium]
LIWFARHEDKSIPEEIVYYYRLRHGVYTLVLKILDPDNYPLNRNFSGLLLIDVDLTTIFSKIFYNTGGIETYIVTSEDKILKSQYSNDNLIKSSRHDIIAKNKINRGPFIARNGKTVLAITQSPLSPDRIVLAIPLAAINRQFFLMILILILIDGALIGLAALVGNAVAQSIVVPLTDLYRKMKEGE